MFTSFINEFKKGFCRGYNASIDVEKELYPDSPVYHCVKKLDPARSFSFRKFIPEYIRTVKDVIKATKELRNE